MGKKTKSISLQIEGLLDKIHQSYRKDENIKTQCETLVKVAYQLSKEDWDYLVAKLFLLHRLTPELGIILLRKVVLGSEQGFSCAKRQSQVLLQELLLFVESSSCAFSDKHLRQFIRNKMETIGYLKPIIPKPDAWETMASFSVQDPSKIYSLKVIRKHYENKAKTVCSFYLIAENNEPLPNFMPGQYLVVEVKIPGMKHKCMRCYSLSDSPGREYYRITIKREHRGPGLVSNYFHDHIEPEDIIEAKAPSGSFYFQFSKYKKKSVVLLSAGAGATPAISTLNFIAENRPDIEVWFFHCARNGEEQIFVTHLKELKEQHNNIHVFIFYSQPLASDRAEDYDYSGRMSIARIAHLLPSEDTDYHISGPGAFIHDLTEELIERDVPCECIHYEAFGAATVKKKATTKVISEPPPPVTEPEPISETQPTVSSDKTVREAQPTVSSDKIVSETQPIVSSDKIVSETQPIVSSGKTVSETQPTISQKSIRRVVDWMFPKIRRKDLPLFEKILSEEAGQPGFVERFFARISPFIRAMHTIAGLRFIIFIHAIDTLLQVVANYIQGIFNAWKMSKSIHRKMIRNTNQKQIQGLIDDVNIVDYQISRLFAIPDSRQKLMISQTAQFHCDFTFPLKMALELRNHLDEMKRDLSLVTDKEVQKTLQSSFSGFLVSFIPNPLDIVNPWKDFFVLAFAMDYKRYQIREIYSYFLSSYQDLIFLLGKFHNEKFPKNCLHWYVNQQDTHLNEESYDSKDIEKQIEVCREHLQRFIQILCHCHKFVYIRCWSKYEILTDLLHAKDTYHRGWLEMEKWLIAEIKKLPQLPLLTIEKQWDEIETNHLRRRCRLQKTMEDLCLF